MTVCLDTWATLRWLDGTEPAATRVESALDSRPLMSWINVGEVYYVLLRRGSHEEAEAAVQSIRAQVAAEAPLPHRVLEAAAIKAWHRVSYADSFAIATARANDAVLLTGDPEILAISAICAVEDLR